MNTIVQTHFATNGDQHYCIVSQYALRCISQYKPPHALRNFLSMAYEKVRNDLNEPLNGWIFELDFLTTIREAKESQDFAALSARFTRNGTSNINYPMQVKSCDDFHSSKDFRLTERQLLTMNDHSWYVPRVFNQGGFDAVELLQGESDKLRFYQVTTSATHSLKLSFMTGFMLNFNELRTTPVDDFDVVFVIPSRNSSTFQTPAPEQFPRSNFSVVMTKHKQQKSDVAQSAQSVVSRPLKTTVDKVRGPVLIFKRMGEA